MPRIKINKATNLTKKVSQRSQGSVILNRDDPLRRKRARKWCFTLNNHTVDDCVSLSQRLPSELNSIFYLFQEECGKNLTKHLQGCVCFRNQVSFSTLKKFDTRIHWEICKNWEASKKYCSKEDTRYGKIYKSVEPPKVKPVETISMEQITEQRIKELIEETIKEKFCLCITTDCVCGMSKSLRAQIEEGASPPLPAISSPSSHPKKQG